jgi:D-methionine transport system ATP-binding protein
VDYIYLPKYNLDNITSKTILKLEQVSLSSKLNTKTNNTLPGYTILQDISFEVIEGERIGIVGVTGSGKTFLLRLLNRLSKPTSGKIYFENRDYIQIPVLQLRQQIVLVPQESKLLGMTVKDALAYPLILRGLPKQEIQQRVSMWVEQLQIPDDWLGRSELQLSAGQKQLVALARALLTQPKILLLDEPTSALDIGTAQRLLQILSQLSETQDTTVIMVNHQLDLVKDFANQILHLSQGRLIANSTIAQTDWTALKNNITQTEAEDDFI